MMPIGQEQLFEDFVHFAATHGSGAVYQRDLHQSVPPGCVFVRFRAPGEGSFTFAGIVQFRQREEGFTACKTFVASRDKPIELRMNFPREIPQNFSSPTFAEAHQVAKSWWRRWATRLGLLVALGGAQR
jgi:hypothetical protein